MNCLVTGGAGFLGSHVAECLIHEGNNVVALDDLSGGFERNIPRGALFQRISVNDPDSLASLFNEYRFRRVYHLAAYAAEGLSHFIRRFNYTNNVVGSANVINECIKHEVECLVFTSSIAVYGARQNPMREDMHPEPEDPYGVAKYAVELDLAAARRMFGLNSIVFRPHNVYGERQHIGDRYRNVVGIFMNQAMRGEAFTLFGDGRQTRAFTHVSDVAPIIARSPSVARAINETFNVGADEPVEVVEIARLVARHMGVELQLNHLEPRNEVVHAYADHSKLQRVFDYRAETPLSRGIKQMADWARGVGSMKPSLFDQIEINRGLPKLWDKKVGPTNGRSPSSKA